MPQNLTERVRSTLKRLHQDRRFSQTTVAGRLNIVPSAVSRTLNTHDPDRPITLEFLEVVADEARVPVAELVTDPKHTLKELNADEAALLRALRTWPISVTRALCAFVAFFADEEPAAAQTRNMHEYWRHLKQPERDVLYGIAVQLRERMLPPDLLKGLEDQLAREANTLPAPTTGRRREKP